MKKLILSILTIMFLTSGVVLAQQTAHVVNINGEQIVKDYQVQLYPNPSVDFLNIKSEGDSFSSVEFEIFSLIGNKVQLKAQKIDETHYRIPVSQYAAGQYILVIKDKSTRYRRAFKFQKVIR